jgi:hypothetical protein
VNGSMDSSSELASDAQPGAVKPGPVTTAYIEVNVQNFANVGKYVLKSSGANVFDIAIIFAANINYDKNTKRAYLYFNERTQELLDYAPTEIAPLQAKGIKVLLSVLGNHQGAGFANFPDQQSATEFARQLAQAATTYGLDGIDFDDEYAEYGKDGTGQPNASSFPYLIRALRDRLPTKIISMYCIGPSSETLSYNGIEVGRLLSYSWNPFYGSWIVPDVPYMTKAQLAPAAVDITKTSASVASALAVQTMGEGYGAYNTYNLTGADASKYLSSFTFPLYGSNAIYTG